MSIWRSTTSHFRTHFFDGELLLNSSPISTELTTITNSRYHMSEARKTRETKYSYLDMYIKDTLA